MTSVSELMQHPPSLLPSELSDDHPLTIKTKKLEYKLLMAEQDHEEAEKCIRGVHSLLNSSYGPEHRDTLEALGMHADTLRVEEGGGGWPLLSQRPRCCCVSSNFSPPQSHSQVLGRRRDAELCEASILAVGSRLLKPKKLDLLRSLKFITAYLAARSV